LVDGRLHNGAGCVETSGSRRSAPGDGQGSTADHSAATVATLGGGGGRELRRQFIRNKTVTCNDGSKAGYVTTSTRTAATWVKNRGRGKKLHFPTDG